MTAGREITETLGVVRENTVRARNIGRDITQGLRNVVGGELKGYTELMSDAREEALEWKQKPRNWARMPS